FDERGNLLAVQIEKSEFFALLFGNSAVLFEFCFFFGASAGVVFLDFVDGLLILVDFLEERLQVRQMYLRLNREIKDSFTDRAIDDGSRDGDVVRSVTAMKLHSAGDLHSIFRLVVGVENLLIHTADDSGFLEQQVALRIKEELLLDSRGRREFEPQRVLTVDLRMTNKSNGNLVFLQIDEPGIVNL